MNYLGEISRFLRDKQEKYLKPVGNFLRHPIDSLVQHSSSYSALQAQNSDLQGRVTGLEGQISGLNAEVSGAYESAAVLAGRVNELQGFQKLAEQYAKRVAELEGLAGWLKKSSRAVNHENLLLADEVTYLSEGLELQQAAYQNELRTLHESTAAALAELKDSPNLRPMFERVYLRLLRNGVGLDEIGKLLGNYGRLRKRGMEAILAKKEEIFRRVKGRKVIALRVRP